MVAVTLQNGFSGVGESAPAQYVTGETQETFFKSCTPCDSLFLQFQIISKVPDLEPLIVLFENIPSLTSPL